MESQIEEEVINKILFEIIKEFCESVKENECKCTENLGECTLK